MLTIPVNEKFGSFVDEETGYIVNASWQSGLNMASTVGAIFGALGNGWATAKWGYKPVCIVGLFFLNAFIFIVFFAPTKAVLLVGQMMCGKYKTPCFGPAQETNEIRYHMGYLRYHRSCLRI